MTLTSSGDSASSFARPDTMAAKEKKPPLFANPLRKRKRRKAANEGDAADRTPEGPCILEDEECDNVSVNSLELSLQPDLKRSKRTMSRFTSLASVVGTPMARVGHAMARSFSGARLQPQSSGGKFGTPSPSSNATSRLPPSAGNLTPTTSKSSFLARSFSTAQMGSGSAPPNGIMAAPESPYGTLKRGAPGRGSSTRLTPYKPPQATPTKQRQTRYWSSTHQDSCAALTKQQINMQEAIYEIYCGEGDLLEDMRLIQDTYAISLQSLKILTPSEVEMVFGALRSLPPVHRELYDALRGLQCKRTGISAHVGRAVLQWVSAVRKPYVEYCSTLIENKAFLDQRRETDKDFSDFLQRCLESPFSRKLDLWAYLDVPRSRLVKYPLLMKQVLKYSECSTDCAMLASAIHNLENILGDVDTAISRARCRHTISRLEWLHEDLVFNDHSISSTVNPAVAVREAGEHLLDGVLRNNRGTKLECHLLDTALVLGRPSTRGAGGGRKRLQVYRCPIPIGELVVEDLEAAGLQGSGKHGSFKSAFTTSQPAKHAFRVSFRNRRPYSRSVSNASLISNGSEVEGLQQQQTIKEQPSSSHHQSAHTLIASDEHSKRQWLTTLQKAIDTRRAGKAALTVRPLTPLEVAVAPITKHGSRTALFQKNKRTSPRIKPTLSQASIDHLKRGGAVRRIRGNNAAATASAGNLGAVLFDENTPVNKGRPPRIVISGASTATKRAKSAIALKALVKQRPSAAHAAVAASASTKRRALGATHNLLRARTQSWSHLVEEAAADGGDIAAKRRMMLQPHRYTTRSRVNFLSKSMSDLIQL